jgi:hypothetical protein
MRARIFRHAEADFYDHGDLDNTELHYTDAWFERLREIGVTAATVPLLRQSDGPSYLRLRSEAGGTSDGGFLVDSAAVELEG